MQEPNTPLPPSAEPTTKTSSDSSEAQRELPEWQKALNADGIRNLERVRLKQKTAANRRRELDGR
jgi:hypothetical protein